MPPLIRALPYSDRKSSVPVRGVAVEVVAYQIVVWVGIAPFGQDRPTRGAPRFPAVIDTGHSGNFSITPSHLRDWAGVEWNTLPLDPLARFQYHGVDVPHRRANLWVYPNQFGWRDQIDPILPPHRLELSGGMAVFGDGVWLGTKDSEKLVGPRLPLLGLRALSVGRLPFRVDPATRTVWLDRP